jgi:hypothetical protein
MPHSIVAYFDNTSDQVIRDTWKALAEAGVCDYLYKSENNPHIKLGMYDNLDVDIAGKRLKLLAQSTEKQKIHFKNIGVYPGDKPIVFLDISATTGVLNLQQQIQSLFSGESHEIGATYFDPGIWKPDCFLTMSIEREKLHQAIDVAMGLPLPFDGFIERIGLIEFHPARQLISCDLSTGKPR